MEKPKVSVIIPVYNTEIYVEEAVRSIMNQTLRDIQIIIIDDGSSDKSLSVIKKLADEDERIYYLSQTNQGQSVARNKGMEIANGEYVYFMDSDDLLAKDAFETCYNKCTSENLDFVFFDAISFFEENVNSKGFGYLRTYQFEEEMVYTGSEMLNAMIDNSNYRAAVWLNFIKLSLLEHKPLNFYPGIIHEDELFTSQLYLFSSRVSCIHQTFYRRRVRVSSIMSQKFNVRNIEGYLTVVKELELIFKKNMKFKVIVNKLIQYILNPAIYNSKDLPLKNRLKVLKFCIDHNYANQIRIKNLMVLVFPFLIDIKAIFKK